VAYPGIFSGGGGLHQEFFRRGRAQQIKLRTEGRESGDLGAVAPQSGVPLNLKMNETRIVIRLLRMYIPRNWEFGSALEKLRNFGGFEHPNPLRYATPTPPPIWEALAKSLYITQQGCRTLRSVGRPEASLLYFQVTRNQEMNPRIRSFCSIYWQV
jgi:hypothetical protein